MRQEMDVGRTVKKATINWAVPLVLGILGLGFLALGREQVKAMLVDYQTKTQASQQVDFLSSRINEYEQQVTSLRTEVSALRDTLYLMDKKLDHLQFALDYNSNNKAMSPKAKEQNP